MEISRFIFDFLILIRILLSLGLATTMITILKANKQSHREMKFSALILAISVIDMMLYLNTFLASADTDDATVPLAMCLSVIVGCLWVVVAFFGWRLYRSSKRNDPEFPHDIIYKVFEL